MNWSENCRKTSTASWQFLASRTVNEFRPFVYCFNNLSNEMLLSLTIFSPRLTDTLNAEIDIFNLLDNFVMFIPNS